jgi:hypothetical protein
MSIQKERRQMARFSLDESVTVSWVDPSGAQHREQARCLDVSEGGLRLELLKKIEAGSYVNVKAEKYKLNASAKVRNAVAKGLRYHVGLEFNSAWKWKELARFIGGRGAAPDR